MDKMIMENLRGSQKRREWSTFGRLTCNHTHADANKESKMRKEREKES